MKWLNAWDALGMKTPSLSLPQDWKNGVQVQDQLWPGELLKNIQVFGVFGVDIYGPWLEACEAQTTRLPVHLRLEARSPGGE